MKKHVAGAFALAAAALLLAPVAMPQAAGGPKPLKVFILAGQSNMDGQANVSTIDFLGEGRFFILLGKAMAEAMQELMGTGDKR